MAKKILYLMHVDWGWIKQRPHFIAEKLSNFYEIEVIHLKSILKKSESLTKKENTIGIHPLYTIPLYTEKLIYPVYKMYAKLYINYFLKIYKPDYIWLTYPSLYDFLPSNGKYDIIYDCMDNATAFDMKEGYKSKVFELEKELIKNATLIFVSANKLASILNNIHDCEDKLFLVNNAFGGQILETTEYIKTNDNKNYKIGYIGTIHDWFDFETVQYTLEKIKNIEYHIIGPVSEDLKELYSHERIIFYGPIIHHELYYYVQEFDCMIMPFKINDLILSVDPVKFYEYINYNKPIISVYYDEIERFSPYINFYSTKKEIVQLLEEMIKTGFEKKYTEIQRIKFLKSNSWDMRIEKIVDCLTKK